MWAPEGKPLQTLAVIHHNQQQQWENPPRLQQGTNTLILTKIQKGSEVRVIWWDFQYVFSVYVCVCCRGLLLAQGQQRVGWSVAADSSLIVWNNWAATKWRTNHALGLIQAFLPSRPPLCLVGVGVCGVALVLLALLIKSQQNTLTKH